MSKVSCFINVFDTWAKWKNQRWQTLPDVRAPDLKEELWRVRPAAEHRDSLKLHFLFSLRLTRFCELCRRDGVWFKAQINQSIISREMMHNMWQHMQWRQKWSQTWTMRYATCHRDSIRQFRRSRSCGPLYQSSITTINMRSLTTDIRAARLKNLSDVSGK